jgi:type VI secretion system ImpC/EvpB family protein
MEFEFDLGGSGKGRARDETTPMRPHRRGSTAMRMLVLGDFSGNPAEERVPLASRPTHTVDVDTLDAVVKRLGPRLQTKSGEIAFSTIDDFHPDALFRRVELFGALRQARTQPPASAAAPGREDLGRLLGKPAETASAPVAPASGIDVLIRDAVAPYIVKDTTMETKAYLAAVDAAAAAEMRTLLRDPAFQALESAWRGVQWLTSSLELDGPLQLHLLDVTREELLADIVATQGKLAHTGLSRALVDRWRNVPGEEGWSLIVALITFGPSRVDMGLLAALGIIASNAGGPLLAGANPSLTTGDADTLANWRALRGTRAAPWIGLATPRVLLRLPYGKASDPIEAFAFEEFAGEPVHDQFLWGNGSLAAALLVGRAFTERGWDMEPGDEREIGDLPAYTFTRDGERQMQPCAERVLTESQIDAMIKAGLIPIASRRDRPAVVAIRFQSIADPPAPLAW